MILLTRVLTGLLLAMVSAISVAPAESGEEGRLLRAAKAGKAERVKELIVHGATLDHRDKDGRTPLLLAARANHVAAARHLVRAGADVNAKDAIGDTPFLYAGAEGRDEILRMILATGRAKLDDTNRYGGTALIPAAHHGHPDTVQILLEAGLDVDHVNSLGWTALLEAVILGDGRPVYQEIVGLLVDAGAANLPDREGVTALEHARSRGFTAIAKRIEAGPRSGEPPV
jgi:ankyrin repeat protein